jgi:hypothetical protein
MGMAVFICLASILGAKSIKLDPLNKITNSNSEGKLNEKLSHNP